MAFSQRLTSFDRIPAEKVNIASRGYPPMHLEIESWRVQQRNPEAASRTYPWLALFAAYLSFAAVNSGLAYCKNCHKGSRKLSQIDSPTPAGCTWCHLGFVGQIDSRISNVYMPTVDPLSCMEHLGLEGADCLFNVCIHSHFQCGGSQRWAKSKN